MEAKAITRVTSEKRKKRPDKEGEMNKGRLIGGIVCLAIAALLAVVIFARPEGTVMFMVKDSNMPWVPVIVLAGLGAGLIGSAPRRQSM